MTQEYLVFIAQIERHWWYPAISVHGAQQLGCNHGPGLAMSILPLDPLTNSAHCLFTFYIFSPGYPTFSDVRCFDVFYNTFSDLVKTKYIVNIKKGFLSDLRESVAV